MMFIVKLNLPNSARTGKEQNETSFIFYSVWHQHEQQL